MGSPSSEALDLLLTQATEIRTYSMHVKGDPNGSVGAGELMAVVSGYAMYLLASAAFDRRQIEGVVALRDLPALMKEANRGVDCEHSDVDFVMDCCNSSLDGSVTHSAVSKEELMPAFAAWQKALSEAASQRGGDSDDEGGSEVTPLGEGDDDDAECDNLVHAVHDLAAADDEGDGNGADALASDAGVGHHARAHGGARGGGAREREVQHGGAPSPGGASAARGARPHEGAGASSGRASSAMCLIS